MSDKKILAVLAALKIKSLNKKGKKNPHFNELVFVTSGLFISMVEIPFDYGCIVKKNSIGPTVYSVRNDVGMLKVLHHSYTNFS